MRPTDREDESDYSGLLVAFWEQARRDLAAGDAEARAWLDTPEFASWAALCGAGPAEARAALLGVWPGQRAA